MSAERTTYNKIGEGKAVKFLAVNVIDGTIRDEDQQIIIYLGFEHKNLREKVEIKFSDEFKESQESELSSQTSYSREYYDPFALTPEAAIKIGQWMHEAGKYALEKRRERLEKEKK